MVGHSDLGARPELIPGAQRVIDPPLRIATPDGELIEVTGCVYDARGDAVPDAMIEIWQANSRGRYASPDDDRDVPLDPCFIGFGRTVTEEDGSFRFRTVRPGRVPGPGNSLQAPHLALSILGRGLLKRLATRLYFSDGEGNDEDPILALVPEARRATLIARPQSDASWRLDIRLGGADETVFFDL